MRSLRRALLWASVAGLWIGCTVNQAGLSDGGLPGDGAPGAGGGSGGASPGRGGATGTGGGAGGVVSGAGGNAGGTGNAGGAGVSGAAGATGAAGSSGAAGDGSTGAAGSDVTGAAGSAGNTGSAGNAGNAGNAGSTGGTDSSGAGGAAGSGVGGSDTSGSAGGGGTGTGGRGGFGGGGGRAGNSGRGGFGGNGARGGNNGRGGTGGNPCASYPQAKAFVTPTDGQVHCYWARSTSQTWSQAQQGCMLQNGHLVTILSAEENDFVVSIAQFSTAFDDTWIGATDDKTGSDRSGPGTYRWVTNEPWGYTNWQQGQPDGFCDPCSIGQTCTCDHRAVLASDGTWNDRWQDNGRSSVCESP